jgi:hypothetical protein
MDRLLANEGEFVAFVPPHLADVALLPAIGCRGSVESDEIAVFIEGWRGIAGAQLVDI